MTGRDRETHREVPLFDPRTQNWAEHFVWTSDGTQIIGTTLTGRATGDRLDLNDDRYPKDDSICATRQLWVQCDRYPPANDPQQK